MPGRYKNTIWNRATGRRREIRNADYTIYGNVEVTGTLTNNGSAVGAGEGGGGSLETPTGAVNGNNDAFEFSSTPIIVFRNGVNETRRGTIDGSTFTFDTPPEEGDDIEGLV